MRFMMIYKPANFRDSEAGIPPTPGHMAEMGKFIAEMVQSGALLAEHVERLTGARKPGHLLVVEVTNPAQPLLAQDRKSVV